MDYYERINYINILINMMWFKYLIWYQKFATYAHSFKYGLITLFDIAESLIKTANKKFRNFKNYLDILPDVLFSKNIIVYLV